MTEQMRKGIESALAWMRKLREEDERPWPYAFLHRPDATLNVYALDNDYMSSWQKKNLLASFLLGELFDHGGVMVFVSDAWRGKLPEGLTRKDMPTDLSEWPKEYRQETLLCMANQIGHLGVAIQQPYDRDARNKPVWQPIDWEHLPVGGRFFYDLRNTNKESAIFDALTRGSEGESVLNPRGRKAM
jgi:hypothetical protein